MAKEKSNKKPFYKKWWVWVIAIIIIGAMASGGGDDETSSTTAEPTKDETSAKDVKKEKVKTYKVGQEVSVQKLAYTVKGVEETDKITAQYLDPITSDSGKFVVVEVTFKNNDKEARTLDTEMFKVLGDDGTEYTANTDADFQLNGDNAMFLETVNPKATRTGKIAFEVPKDEKSYTLEVSGGLGWSGGKYAKIKLK